MILPAGLLATVMALIALPASAFEPLTGCLVARQACPATTRLAGSENEAPMVEAGQSYRLLGANSARPTHYQIRLPQAGDRWVQVTCGRRVAACAEATPDPASRYVLALSWQPAFCEVRPTNPQCRSQHDDRPDATHLTLHGLWPQPRAAIYCGVPDDLRALDEPATWHRLPPVALETATRAALTLAMPGTQSHLDRHEWLKHGTCYGAPAESYFRHSLRLLNELNASPVRSIIVERIGRRLTSAELARSFDAAFGPGAGARVAMDCTEAQGRRLLIELRLNLEGAIGEEAGLRELLAAAPPAATDCRSGEVDAVGQGG